MYLAVRQVSKLLSPSLIGQVIDTFKQMPENFSIDQLFDKLNFINKVEIGLAQSANGQVNTKEQAKEKLSKWLK